ncbi:MAG: hypothetical protein M4579_000436 [Chaenotheca gracillima]|nr:MAG: hypothetical protein M4579_000436 [Chaenotheca gracillima]
MTPRRSSRARTTQPPNGPQQTPSSSSSTSSGQNERSTRSVMKGSSPHKSAASRSPSEDLDGIASDPPSELPQTRRRRRQDTGVDDLKPKDPGPVSGIPGQNDEEEEEEVTRCICGFQDYPGRPVNPGAEVKPNVKDDVEQPAPAIPSDPPTDDSGVGFILCDSCKVWQHGGCVDVNEMKITPEEYFCEQCRRDLHKIMSAPNGQKYSQYLPLIESQSPPPSRSGSRSKDTEFKSPMPRASRNSAIGPGGKRRSTMNSRDAAYDEEEQLRIAIEQSKTDGTSITELEATSRRMKRSRSESEEMRQLVAKRQRTNSGSPSNSQSNSHSTSHNVDSEDEDGPGKTNTNASGRKIRGAAARNHREKELRDRERSKEKEKERIEAAARRKGRAERAAERRKLDDAEAEEAPTSDPAPPKPTIAQAQDLPSSQAPGTPPSNTQPTQATTSHRKTGRPPARRGRVGRNQYTKDRDPPSRDRDGSLNRSQSRDGLASEDPSGPNGFAHHGTNGDSSSAGKPSKPKYMHPQRTTMNEMKRRVAGILEFISKTQVEMAGERTPPSSTGAGAGPGSTAAAIKSLAEGLIDAQHSGDKSQETSTSNTSSEDLPFEDLNSLQMMDVLTRKLVLWQKDFGKWGEK